MSSADVSSMSLDGTEKQESRRSFSEKDEPLPYPGWTVEGDYSWLYER